MSLKLLFIAFLLSINLFATTQPTLIFYCGITMVQPMKEMVQIFEKHFDCKIKILQGASQDLYDTLSFSKKGDLYLPGSDTYRKDNIKHGYFLDFAYIGYNQAAIFVRKNNPKKIFSLDSLIKENINTILADPDSGSIGKITKKILYKYKGEPFFYKAYDNSTMLGTDSRNLNYALIHKSMDMTINWKATAYLNKNKKFIQIIPLPKELSPKKEFPLILLKSSKHQMLSKEFIKFSVSKEGQAIMKKYGFID